MDWQTDPITSANEANAEFDIIGAAAGNTYDFTITSSGGGTPITGNGTIIADPTPRILDVSSLNDGTITVEVTVTNIIGTGPPTTDVVEKGAVPSGYDVSWLTDPIDSANETNAQFQLTGVTAGNTYDFTISSSGGGTDITGSGTVGSDPQTITEDVSGLPDGTLTVEVTETSSFGTGLPVSDTVTKAAQLIDITIGDPVPTSIVTGTGDVTFTITYGNADTITLATGDITLNTTNSASADIAVTGTGSTTRTVTLSNITGTGEIGFTIAAGTATNGLGGVAGSAVAPTAVQITSGVSDSILDTSPVLYMPTSNIQSATNTDGEPIISWDDVTGNADVVVVNSPVFFNGAGSQVQWVTNARFDVEDIAALDFTPGTDEFTIIVREGDDLSGTNRYLLSKADDTGTGRQYAIFKGSGDVVQYVVGGLAGPSFGLPPFNNRLHILVVKTTGMDAWVDGLQKYFSQSIGTNTATNQVNVGARTNGSSVLSAGSKLDIVAIIPSAITPAQRIAIETEFLVNPLPILALNVLDGVSGSTWLASITPSGGAPGIPTARTGSKWYVDANGDWQEVTGGNAVIDYRHGPNRPVFPYESQINNIAFPSEPTSDPAGALSENITYGAFSWDAGGFTNAVNFGDNSVQRTLFYDIDINDYSTGNFGQCAVFIQMDDNSTPVYNTDFECHIENAVIPIDDVYIEPFYDSNVYRVTFHVDNLTSPFPNSYMGVRKLVTHSAKTFKVTGFMMADDTATRSRLVMRTYIPTTTGVVNVDSDNVTNTYDLLQDLKSEGTIYIKGVFGADSGSWVTAGKFNDYFVGFYFNAVRRFWNVNNADLITGSFVGAEPVYDGKFCFAWSGNTATFSFNGSLNTTTVFSQAFPNPVDLLQVRVADGECSWYDLEELEVYDVRLTDAQIVGKTV